MRLPVAAIATCLVLTVAGGSQAASTSWSTLKLRVASVDATVTVDPAGVIQDPRCPSNVCVFSYPSGTSVTLTAVQREISTFVEWYGGCSGSAPTCVIGVSGSRYVRASFTPVTLSYTISDGGYIKRSPPGNSCGKGCNAYQYGNYKIRVDAIANPGYDFTGWVGDCAVAGTNGCLLTMNLNHNAYAGFRVSSNDRVTSPLTTTVTTDIRVTGSGTVTGSNIGCRAQCSTDRDRGATIVVTAAESSGWHFDHWSGRCSGTARTCTFANVLSVRHTRPLVHAWFLQG
jgi:hypothetical protein